MNASPTVGKPKLVAGVRWTASSQLFVQAGKIILAVILARILVPSDFGLVSLVMIVTAFIDVAIGDVGTAAAIVQRQEMTDDEVSTMFWFNVMVGITLTGLAEFGAPLMQHVLDHESIVPAFRVVSITFTIAGFRMAHHALVRKNLQYRTLAVIDAISFVTNFVVAVVLAVMGAGFWSMIIGSLSANLAMTIGVWAKSGFRPARTFRVSHLKAVARFSLNLSAYRFINFFSQQGDRFLIGAYVSADALGFYSQANRLVLYPLDTAGNVYRRVLVPAMSKDQTDDRKLRVAFLRSTGVIAVSVMPFTVLSFVLAEPLILALPGEKWLPAVPLIRLLAVVGLVRTVSGQTGVIFHIKNRTDLLLYWGTAAAIVTVSAYVIGLQWGVEGVAWGYAIAMVLVLFPSYYLPMRLINTPMRALWPVFRGVLLAGVALFVTSLLVLNATEGPGVNSWIPLLAGTSSGGVVYLGILVATRNQSLLDLVEIGSPAMAKKLAKLSLRSGSAE